MGRARTVSLSYNNTTFHLTSLKLTQSKTLIMSDNPEKVDFTVYREIQSPFNREDLADDSQISATDASLQELTLNREGTLTNPEGSLNHPEVRPFKPSSILAFFTPNGPSPAGSSTSACSGPKVNKLPLAIEQPLIDRSINYQTPPIKQVLTDRSPTSLAFTGENNRKHLKQNLEHVLNLLTAPVEAVLIDHSTPQPPPVEDSIFDCLPTSQVSTQVTKENKMPAEPALTDRSPTSLAFTRANNRKHFKQNLEHVLNFPTPFVEAI